MQQKLLFPAIAIAVGVLGGWTGASTVAAGGFGSVSLFSFGNSWTKTDEGVLTKLDEVAAHPDDPSLPSGVKGVSDAEFADLDFAKATELYELGQTAVLSPASEARHFFEMYRLASHLGDQASAGEYLTAAADAGSAIAHAYLGDMWAEEGDRETAMAHFEAAVAGGYAGAQAPLDFYRAEIAAEEEARRLEQERVQREAEAQRVAEAQAAQQRQARAQNLQAKYMRPDIISALTRGDSGAIRSGGIQTVAYLAGMNEVLEDPSLRFSHPGIHLEINPKVSRVLGYKMSTSPALVGEMNNMSMNMLGDFFGAIVETRQRGGSITEEMTAINESFARPGLSIGGAKAEGQKDGYILAELYLQDPDAFRKIYGNLILAVDSM